MMLHRHFEAKRLQDQPEAQTAEKEPVKPEAVEVPEGTDIPVTGPAEPKAEQPKRGRSRKSK